MSLVRATHIQLLKGRAIAQQVMRWPADLAGLGQAPSVLKGCLYWVAVIFFILSSTYIINPFYRVL